MVMTGKCRHGEFNLLEGCPLCIVEKWEQSTGDALPSVGSITATSFVEKTIPLETLTALVKVKPETDVQVQSFYSEALKAKEYAEARVITTVEDLKPATDDLSLIAKLKKAMEEKRKEYVSPLQSHVKAVNDTFKILMEPIETADTITRNKILAFQLKQKLIREEQERINALRFEAAQKEMELKGEISEPVGLVEVIPEAPKTTKTDLGSTYMMDTWLYEVIDFVLLPDEYKVADHTMLNAIAKKHHDQKQIPGVRFFNKPILAVRAR